MNNSRLGIPSRFAGLDTDILSLDDYITNQEGRSVGEILDSVAAMNDASIETRKPSLVFLAGSNLFNHYREPTAGEQVAQTYGSVIKGAAGVWYFGGIPFARKHWEAYKQLNSELLSLSDVLFSGEAVDPIASDQSAVISLTRRHGGKIYLITVNIENRPATASFRLPGGVKTAGVLFENRQLKVADGVLKDDYAPHERHVYSFEARN